MPFKRVTATLEAASVIGSTVLAGGSAVAADSNPSAPPLPKYDHIWLIVEENHAYSEVVGNSNLPFLNQLASQNGLATNYFGVTHPSEPNYVAMIGGSYFGIQDDAPYTTHQISQPSLASQLEGKGLTWKAYQQNLPEQGWTGTAYPSSSITLYAAKHNPFLNFQSVSSSPTELAKIVPDTQLEQDLASGNVPNFSFISPDQCHDMHGISNVCTEAATSPVLLDSATDEYVKSTVRAIEASDAWNKGQNAIAVTWDEDDFAAANQGCCDANPGGGPVATIVVKNHDQKPMQDATPYNHYSLLATIQQAFGLGCLQYTCDTANVRPMTPLFSPGSGVAR